MVEMIWKEPPPAVSSEKAPVLAELQKNPGRWALVQTRYKSSSGATAWRKLGCEVAHRRVESADSKSMEYDIYARWPEAKPGATKPAAPAGQPKSPAVEKAISTGTALKPSAAAAPRKPDHPESSMGFTKFLANQRAGTVAAAAE